MGTVGVPWPKMIDLLFGGLRRISRNYPVFGRQGVYAHTELPKHLKVQAPVAHSQRQDSGAMNSREFVQPSRDKLTRRRKSRSNPIGALGFWRVCAAT